MSLRLSDQPGAAEPPAATSRTLRPSAIRFARLDMLTVKPYLTVKNALIFLVVAVFVGFGIGNTSGTLAVVMMIAVVYAGYPFAVGERSNLDALYVMLSVSRRTVVAGRYLFVAALDVAAALLAVLVSLPIVVWLSADPVELACSLVAVLIAVVLMECLQLPIYFKVGYTKGRAASYVPALALVAVVVLAANLVGSNEALARQLTSASALIAANPLLATLLLAAALVAVVAVSLAVSTRFYQAREF
ncbi:MAG: ABC-2 transporter permease [Propionibacteriaceae bacterium]|jgi:hypothetical protein|nr:ABC-2 transporter permease [Propionibacteriaceae bacterium]